MKQIILSIVGVLAVLWVALFVSGQQVLVWEERQEPFISDDPPLSLEECQAWVREQNKKRTEGQGRILDMCSVNDTTQAVEATSFMDWKCTYFNGRRLIKKEYSASRTACPNFRKNQ
jgi:hypothetical protein